MKTYEDIVLRKTGRVLIVKVNRPGCMNALRMHTKEELDEVFEQVRTDETIGGVIITGEGKGFIAGSDINEMSIGRPGEETVQMSTAANKLISKIEEISKPFMAAINGYALGGGLELALACDFRIASKKAAMGLTEINLGVAPCYGGTQRLPRLIGTAKAKELLFTARMLNAEEALAWGLINSISEPENLMDDAVKMMQKVAEKSEIAIRYLKKCVNQGMEMPLMEGIRYESKVAGILIETEDAREGVTAFLEKRKPHFNKEKGERK